MGVHKTFYITTTIELECDKKLADTSGAMSAMGIQDISVDHEDQLLQLQEELAQPPNASGGEEDNSISDKNKDKNDAEVEEDIE